MNSVYVNEAEDVVDGMTSTLKTIKTADDVDKFIAIDVLGTLLLSALAMMREIERVRALHGRDSQGTFGVASAIRAIEHIAAQCR